MSKTVIEVQNLSKQYQLGMLYHNSDSFRDYAAQAFIGLAKKIKANKTIWSKRISPQYSAESNTQNTFDRDKYFWAIKDISFEVKEGEILGIIGNNGAGKSTLLKILSRITKPTSGKALINGRVGSLLEVGTGFHPEFTGRENIYLNGSILGMKRIEISKKFDEIVNFSEIEKFLDTPVKRYSSGMYVRLAFAVAAHLDPEILLVDEVLSVGDISFQKKCLGKIQEVGKKGRTVVFISHHMRSIRNLCSYALCMKEGKIINQGLPQDVVNSYELDNIGSSKIKPSGINLRKDKQINNTTFFIKSIAIQNTDGKNTIQFKYQSTLVLDTTLSGEPNTNHFSFEFRIYGFVGEAERSKNLLCVGASGPYHNIYFERGVRKIRVKIGPLTLSNGDYSISTSIVSGNIREDTWDDCCFFQIIDCQPHAIDHEISLAGCILNHSFSILE
jgi:lipopolysaccharide transport system ATP-binding protein